MNERRPENRLRGIRKAAGAALLTVSLAACGDNQPATQTPVLPTEQPTPTIIVTPTPEVTPVPTPTPEITPKPVVLSEFIDEIIAEGKADGFPKTSVSKIRESIGAALEADPEAASTISDPRVGDPYSETLYQALELCETGGKSGHITMKEIGCIGLGNQLWDAYSINKNELFLAVLKNEINYLENKFPKDTSEYMIEEIKKGS